MIDYVMKNKFGNPSSLHSEGQNAKKVVDAARIAISKCIGCDPE